MTHDRFRGRSEESPLPKPYDFVPLPIGNVPKAAPAGHHIYKPDSLTGTLTATIIARSPVHVASGLLEPTRDRQYPLVKAHFRTNGKPAIPGTSLKGCIRSIVEAITHSSVQVTRVYDLPEEYRVAQIRERDRREQTAKLDIAQRIFGAMGYQGTLCFADAVLEYGNTSIVPSVQLFRPRSESLDAYFDGRKPRGRKFYMHGKVAEGDLPLETCDINSQFKLYMRFENMQTADIGLVLIALGLGAPHFCPKLGGAKPACLGTIEVTQPAIQVFKGSAAYTDFDAQPQEPPLQMFIDAAQPLVQQAQLTKLAEILCWPREDRECPDRNY